MILNPPTGSIGSNKTVGNLDFFEDGTVTIFMSKDETIEKEITDNFVATAEFILYALSRPDWMGAFFLERPELFEDVISKISDKSNKPNLVLIEGGKEE